MYSKVLEVLPKVEFIVFKTWFKNDFGTNNRIC